MVGHSKNNRTHLSMKGLNHYLFAGQLADLMMKEYW